MQVFNWTIYTVLLPLSPLLIVTLIASQPEKTIPYEDILGGTELLLICLFIAATTYRDLNSAKARFTQSGARECMSLLLLMWVYVAGMMCAFVFLHVHVQDLGLRAKFVANAGLVFGILTTAICLTAQLLLASEEKAKRGDGGS